MICNPDDAQHATNFGHKIPPSYLKKKLLRDPVFPGKNMEKHGKPRLRLYTFHSRASEDVNFMVQRS